MSSKKCAFCEKEAAFYVSSSRYERQGDDSVVRKNSGGHVCPTCLTEHLMALENAHHFVYRIDASYHPHSCKYDDGLILAVLECARYRGKTVQEFMARADQLIEWYGDVSGF